MRFATAWASFYHVTRQATRRALRSYFDLPIRRDKSNTRIMLDVSSGYMTARARWSALFVGAVVTGAVTNALVGLAPQFPSRGVEYSTGASKWHTITLEDGTVATLGPNTQLNVRFEKERRCVELKSGEAIYKVADEPARPFLVRTRYAEVKARETQFVVGYLAESAVAVTVANGRVTVRSVAHDSEAVELRAGQQIIVSASSTTDPINVDVSTELRRFN